MRISSETDKVLDLSHRQAWVYVVFPLTLFLWTCSTMLLPNVVSVKCEGNACIMTRRSLLRTQAPVSINAFLTLYANADHWDRSFAEDMHFAQSDVTDVKYTELMRCSQRGVEQWGIDFTIKGQGTVTYHNFPHKDRAEEAYKELKDAFTPEKKVWHVSRDDFVWVTPALVFWTSVFTGILAMLLSGEIQEVTQVDRTAGTVRVSTYTILGMTRKTIEFPIEKLTAVEEHIHSRTLDRNRFDAKKKRKQESYGIRIVWGSETGETEQRLLGMGDHTKSQAENEQVRSTIQSFVDDSKKKGK